MNNTTGFGAAIICFFFLAGFASCPEAGMRDPQRGAEQITGGSPPPRFTQGSSAAFDQQVSPKEAAGKSFASSEIAADFRIKRIELYFENRRAEITIPKNTSPLKAYANISYSGSGLLEGYWEVDGRVLARFSRHVTAGRPVALQYPDTPALPTFDPGTHILKFLITRPSPTIPMPSIVYFVSADESPDRLPGIELLLPENQALLDYAPQRFRWRKMNDSNLYLIQYFDKSKKSIFSAYTKKRSYNLPLAALKYFAPDADYTWKVTGYGPQNKINAESRVQGFRFNPPGRGKQK